MSSSWCDEHKPSVNWVVNAQQCLPLFDITEHKAIDCLVFSRLKDPIMLKILSYSISWAEPQLIVTPKW